MLVGGERKLAEFRTRPPSCNDVIVVVMVTLTLMTSRVADAADNRDAGSRAAVTWYDDVTEYRRNSVLQHDDPLDEVDNIIIIFSFAPSLFSFPFIDYMLIRPHRMHSVKVKANV